MAGLAWHNFTSAAAGIAVALAMARGFTRTLGSGQPRTLGSFWVDLMRSTLYVLLPISVVGALVLVAQGVIQNFSPYLKVTTLEGATQTIAMGPVASQEVIKELGTNGGGFFNANSAHPFENPTPLTNFLELVLIFLIPAGLTYTYGRMAKDSRQGWCIFAAMSVLFLSGVAAAYWAESHPNPALHGMPVNQAAGIADGKETRPAGNFEGKETRFGIANSALWATVTTDTSCGAVNSMHDSFTPLGGLVPLTNIKLGEVIFGGVGVGLYRHVDLRRALGLHRRVDGRPHAGVPGQEDRDPRGQVRHGLRLDLRPVHPRLLRLGGGHALGHQPLNNAGPHGLSEILYAYTSACGNNGSAFAGLNANTPWWNVTLGLTMLAGRFLMIIPVLAIAGSMVGKKTVPAGLGTFPTNGPLFTVLLLGVVIIVGALTFFPAVTLGPILEEFASRAGKLY